MLISEIQSADDLSLLLRGNTLFAQTLTTFLNFHAHAFLHTFIGYWCAHSCPPSDQESDDQESDDHERKDLFNESDATLVEERVSLLLEILFVAKLPSHVREMLTRIAQTTQAKFGSDSANHIFSEYLFLRFLIPSLSASEYHIPCCPSVTPSHSHRILTLISNIFQCAVIDQEMDRSLSELKISDVLEKCRCHARSRLFSYLDTFHEKEAPPKIDSALEDAVNSYQFICHRLRKRTCIPSHSAHLSSSSQSATFFGSYFAKYSVRIKESVRQGENEDQMKEDLLLLKRFKTYFPKARHTEETFMP